MLSKVTVLNVVTYDNMNDKALVLQHLLSSLVATELRTSPSFIFLYFRWSMTMTVWLCVGMCYEWLMELSNNAMLVEMLHLWLLLSIQLFILNYHTTRVTLFYTFEQENKDRRSVVCLHNPHAVKKSPSAFSIFKRATVQSGDWGSDSELVVPLMRNGITLEE